MNQKNKKPRKGNHKKESNSQEVQEQKTSIKNILVNQSVRAIFDCIIDWVIEQFES